MVVAAAGEGGTWVEEAGVVSEVAAGVEEEVEEEDVVVDEDLGASGEFWSIHMFVLRRIILRNFGGMDNQQDAPWGVLLLE